MQNVFSPAIEAFQNPPNLLEPFLIVILIEVVLLLGYFFWKLIFHRPLPTESNNNETKNNKSEKIEISKPTFILLAIILPAFYFMYMFF